MTSACGHLPRHTGGDDRKSRERKRKEGFAICELNPESVIEAEVAAERMWVGKVPQCTFIYSKEDMTKLFTDAGSFCKNALAHGQVSHSYKPQNIHSSTTKHIRSIT